MSSVNRRRRERELKRRRRRRRILIIEIIVLILLAIVMIVAIRGTQLLGLINRYQTDDDKLVTASEANQQYQEQNGGNSSDTQGTQSTGNTTTQQTGYEVIALVGLDTRSASDDPDDISYNSDTMIICVIDHNNKAIRLCSVYRDSYLNIGKDYYGNPDYYTKANSAYNFGGPEQFMSMLNLNLDLNITEFITVDFSALTKCIDLLGGIDINMTREEAVHVNNYNVETAANAGVEYEELEIPDDPNFDGEVRIPFHCNGSQAVSYARIRYTAGSDYRRASRQREVLSLIKEKAATADIFTLNSVLDAVLPYVTTNMDASSIISLALNIVSYDMSDGNMSAFPSVHAEDPGGERTGLDCVISVTLEYNVEKLHEFLFPGEAYSPSYTVQQYSDQIVSDSGYSSDDIEYFSQINYGEALGGISMEEFLESQESENGTS
jgi:LCP family protein required for cell wall assembly